MSRSREKREEIADGLEAYEEEQKREALDRAWKAQLRREIAELKELAAAQGSAAMEGR